VRLRDLLSICEMHGHTRHLAGVPEMDLEVGGLCFLPQGGQPASLQPGQVAVMLAGDPESLENARALADTLGEGDAVALLVVIPADEAVAWHEGAWPDRETPVVGVSVSHDKLFCLVGQLLRLFPSRTARHSSALPDSTRRGVALASLQHIADELALHTSTIVTIKDTEFEVLAFSAAQGAGDAAVAPCRVSPEAVALMRRSGLLAQLNKTSVPLRMPPVESAGLGPRVVMPIRGLDKEVLGYIRIVEGVKERGLEESFRDDITQAAKKAAVPVLYHRALKNPRECAVWDFLDALFAGMVDSDRGARAQLRELGCKPLPYCFVMVFGVDLACEDEEGDGPQEEEDRRLQLCQQHLRAYQAVGPVLAKSCRHGYGLARMGDMVEILVFWEDFLDKQDVRRLARDVYSRMVSSVCTPRLKLSAGVGGVTQQMNTLFRSYQEAVGAVDIGRSLWGPGRLTYADDLGLLRALAEKSKTPGIGEAFTRFWGVLEEYDFRHGTELSRTVATFLDCLGSIRRSAKSLYVHPNTVLYRLRKAEQLTAMALNDPNVRMLVHLELKLRQIMLGRTRSNFPTKLEPDSPRSGE